MEDDPKLGDLLKAWEVSDAPKTLDARVARFRKPWWKAVLTGSIRLPIPVGVAIAGALLAMAIALLRLPAEAPITPSISLKDFRPVSNLNIRVIHGHETN